ncbi:putative dehydrogenase [Prosthecobacter fusiformis]|uniref:Putative dehydrogenase n=1 Tax=Prosthecobacter fusiformis TaxID=48464 RepID=A0A4R7SPQ0_9BACT|nr:Gfo/Idh/MocA family oxidoreductase [Prosthecobacter fusiformis]TDU81192.1 putative dehydrogenase [Prosthecobacter fusiformis]
MNRRHFLTTAAALAAASSHAAPPSRLRIGQIGTAHAHAAGKMAAMRSLTDLWEVTGIVEPNPATQSTVTSTDPYQGLPLLTEEKLLATPDLKAVVVETRVEASCATALRCIQAGKHVHLDKPGSLDHTEFKTMRLEAEKRGLTVQIGYMLRYNPAFTLLFKAVREGWLGEITEIDAVMGKLADPLTRKDIGALPGGGMFELGCHVMDAVLTLLGKPDSVHPFSTPNGKDGVKDNQLAILQYPKATAVIRVNHTDPFGGPRRRFNVTGTQGTFEILPLESGRVNLSLTLAQGGYKKGAQSFQLEVPKGRYDLEFVDLAQILQGEKKLAWDAAHDIALHETVLRASATWPGA